MKAPGAASGKGGLLSTSCTFQQLSGVGLLLGSGPHLSHSGSLDSVGHPGFGVGPTSVSFQLCVTSAV